MGFLPVKDVLRTACTYQFFQYFSDAWVFNACCQLSIAEGTCAALTKLDIGFRIKLTGIPKSFHRGCPCVHILSPFQNQRPISCPCQSQCRKYSRRTESDDYRPVLKRPGVRHCNRFHIPHIRCDLKSQFTIWLKFQRFPRGLCRNHCKIHRVHQPDSRLVPCIDGFLHYFPFIYQKTLCCRPKFL